MTGALHISRRYCCSLGKGALSKTLKKKHADYNTLEINEFADQKPPQ